ncbi:site-specific integrase [Microbacterium sp. SGAir0570]|nr:site-specific integrase [Microbacterium sp. SGAir0570]
MASVKKRPNGRWRARYTDAQGKEHARHFELKRDAERWIDEVTAAVVTGQYADPRAGKVTWRAWVEAWMSRQVWADGTHEAARTSVMSVPWLDSAIGSVRPSHVQAWISGESKRGLAASTIRTRVNYVQMAFRAATLDRVIPTNPAEGAKSPRTRRSDAAMKLLTVEQVAAALDAAGDFRPFVAVCAFAGLRLGEAAGLRVKDVNFLRRTIGVRQQVQGSTHKTAKIVPPKAGSERDVFGPDGLMSVLSLVDRSSSPDALLFRTPLGQMWHRNNAGEEWRRIRKAAGLPEDVTLHALRHTYASSLIAAGCDVVTVQRALGHSQPSITLNVYSHLWPSAEDKTRAAAADFMASVLAPADNPRTADGKAQVRG